MNFAEIYHRTTEQMSYPLNEDELIISLKTGYDIRRVYIRHGDPFEAGILGGNEKWTGTREELREKKRLKHQLFWSITLRPPYKRCKYYFELHSDTEVWYYFENGFLTERQKEQEGRILQCFTVPWMNPADINRTPGWVRETVWYQIFPDRFCRECPGRDDGAEPWREGPVRNEERFGGNLRGIISRLSYLEELGISGIYLNPVFKAPSNHKYDTEDYTEIDPSLGTQEDLEELVRQAHSRGIRVMLDGVFNHCGSRFAPWQDVLKNGRSSRYFDWFMIERFPFDSARRDTRDKSFYSFAFSARMPKLNTNNEEVIQYFSDLCADWALRYGVDGIRFDVGNEVSHRFLKAVRRRLKAINPEFYLLGEIWHDASQWLMGDEYDSVMNYPLMESVNDFFLDRELKSRDLEAMLNRCYTMYMRQNNEVLFNLLDSHDTERLISRAGSEDRFFQQLALLFVMPGSPCIYYGTEIALPGGHDPDCRRCMPWNRLEEPENRRRREEISRLIRLRRSEPAMQSAEFEVVSEDENSRRICIVKQAKESRIELILNCGEDAWSCNPKGEAVFARGYEDGRVAGDGVVLVKKN